MKTQIKKTVLPFLFILACAFTQQVQAQVQQTKEYATIGFNNSEYIIAYSDGKIETIKMEPLKNTEKNVSQRNDILNMLAKKGYKLVGNTDWYFYFEK